MKRFCSKSQRDKRTFLPWRLFTVLWVLTALGLLTVGCAPQPSLARGASLTLTTFSENDAAVIVQLRRAADGQVFLVATFTPLEAGFHLYSKDLPRNGVGGLGRPTLLELTPNSRMRASGALTESVASEVSGADPSGVLIYPNGPVTLTLPVRLPAGGGWVDDEISLTYVVCSANGCKAPVTGQILPIKVPGAGALTN
ncbi:MAG: hypothetical protein WA821_06640 [Anaerolineales bacterium]